MDKGGAGKTVCQQSYRGRDRDEDLSEDAIIRTESERERDLGNCYSGDAKAVKCCSKRKIERVKGQRNPADNSQSPACRTSA